MCRAAGAFLHTDAAQAVGKIPMSVNDMNIDLMSISGHKIYGPKGIGAIYIRRFVERMSFSSQKGRLLGLYRRMAIEPGRLQNHGGQ